MSFWVSFSGTIATHSVCYLILYCNPMIEINGSLARSFSSLVIVLFVLIQNHPRIAQNAPLISQLPTSIIEVDR